MLGFYIEDIKSGRVEGVGLYRLTIGRPVGRELTIRSRKIGYLMAGQVEDTYVALAAPIPARGKNNLAPVRGPARICLLPVVLGKKALRATARGGNNPGMPALRGRRYEQDLATVR